MKYSYNMGISLALVFLILIVPTFAMVAATPNDEGVHNSYFGGTVYTGSLLKVGFNDYGALGIVTLTQEAVGFQYPIGDNFESLAWEWFGEGYAVFYGSSWAEFAPSDDATGTLVGVTPTINVESTPFGQIQTCTLITNDSKLQLTFKLLFFTDEKFCIIQSYIKNLGTMPISDLEFRRICDWDLWNNTFDFWGKDDVRHPELNMAVAFKNMSIATGTDYMGFATCVTPNNWTLGWNNNFIRGFDVFTQYFLDANGNSPVYFDGRATYQWLGTLNPDQTVMFPTIYAAGNTLDELEANAAEAQLWQNYVQQPAVGGSVVPVDTMAVLSPYLALFALVAAVSVTIALVVKRRPY